MAVSVSVMLEGWAEGSAPGIGPMGNPLKPGVRDLQALSWAEYGPKVGTWRLLDLLDRAGRKAVFYTSGVVAERYPALPAAIAGRGHVVAAHAWCQGTLPPYLSPEAEWADIVRCREVLAATAGTPPLGWLSPRCTPSGETSRFLARAGFRWHADMFDSDVPYRVETAEGTLVGMPFTMEVNDMPLYVRYGNAPEAFTGVLRRLLDGWPQRHNAPGIIDVTVHAHVFGRPFGAIELRAALDLIRPIDWAWPTTHAALAELYAPSATRAAAR